MLPLSMSGNKGTLRAGVVQMPLLGRWRIHQDDEKSYAKSARNTKVGQVTDRTKDDNEIGRIIIILVLLPEPLIKYHNLSQFDILFPLPIPPPPPPLYIDLNS